MSVTNFVVVVRLQVVHDLCHCRTVLFGTLIEPRLSETASIKLRNTLTRGHTFQLIQKNLYDLVFSSVVVCKFDPFLPQFGLHKRVHDDLLADGMPGNFPG
jgi:hypothetical protein